MSKNFILTIIVHSAIAAWTFIFFFLRNKDLKCTFHIVKLITTATIILSTLFSWILSTTIDYLGKSEIIMDLIFFSTSQGINSVSFFNIYAFVFEFRNPKIDPNLPKWITMILGVFIPFSMTGLTLVLDKYLSPDFSEFFDSMVDSEKNG